MCSQNGKLVKIGKNGKPVQTSQNGIQKKLLKSVLLPFWPILTSVQFSLHLDQFDILTQLALFLVGAVVA